MIKVDKLYKSFGGHDVHKGIDLEIKKGAITYIIGPSGTGKSVLLKQLMGLIKPDSGNIYVDGKNITTANKKQLLKIRYKFGMLFQNAALFDSLTVYENVAFPLKEHRNLSESEMMDIVTDKLKLVGLSGVNNRYPSELSGGMRKRVGLARAIALSPDIMMYDEPTTGLDPIMTDVVDDLIYTTQKELNITSIVISHDIPSVLKNADYIGMLYNGKIIQYGTPEYFKKTDNEYVRQFFSGSKDGPIKVF